MQNQDGGGRRLEFYKNRYNSAKYSLIFMKLKTMVQNNMPSGDFTKPEVKTQNQYGGGRHLEF